MPFPPYQLPLVVVVVSVVVVVAAVVVVAVVWAVAVVVTMRRGQIIAILIAIVAE